MLTDFMLSVWLLVNSKLLLVTVLGGSKVTHRVSTACISAPLYPHTGQGPTVVSQTLRQTVVKR